MNKIFFLHSQVTFFETESELTDYVLSMHDNTHGLVIS